jgi:flavin-dependent dehydrogenase
VKQFTGKGYICLGDAHRFLDPIFSFGLLLALTEARIAAPVVRAYLEGVHRDRSSPFADYQIVCEKGMDILEDAIDTFWENPIAFALLTHHRYLGLMTDIFAGRVYDRQPSAVVQEFRQVLQRERTYDHSDDYSLPIGSRYHPERAPLWEANSSIDGTGAWIGPR